MKIIELKNKVIYRAENGKKVKFEHEEDKYSEIVVKEQTNKIVEVDE